MKKEILDRFVELGADISQLTGESLSKDLQSLRFQNFLFDEDYLRKI